MVHIFSQTTTPTVRVSNIAVKISVVLQILSGVKFLIAQLVAAYLVLEVLRLVVVELHLSPTPARLARLAHSCQERAARAGPESEGVVGATGIGEREDSFSSRPVIPVI